MKIFSVAWGWTAIPEEMPVNDSLLQIADKVKQTGFDGIDYLSTFESLDTYFTNTRCSQIRKYCASLELPIGGLVFQSDLWNNPDFAVQNKQLEYFEKCVNTAVNLGASTISCIIPKPFGARGTRVNASPSEKKSYKLPAGYSWQKDWDLFTSMIIQAVQIAASRQITVALECFPGSLCSTPHAMCQIIETINNDYFGIQLDTAHLINQAIDIETAIYMLGAEHIKNVHFKDSDGLTRTNLPAGSGLVDYPFVLDALYNVGYNGNASIEVEFTDNPGRYMKQALDHIRLCQQNKY